MKTQPLLFGVIAPLLCISKSATRSRIIPFHALRNGRAHIMNYDYPLLTCAVAAVAVVVVGALPGDDPIKAGGVGKGKLCSQR